VRGLFFDGTLRFRKGLPVPDRPPGWALVRVLAAGICNTDLEIVRGYMDFRGVPGHEFVGRVEAAGTRALVGRRVVGEINVPCGACDTCRRGDGRHCPTRKVLGIAGLDGAFAEALVLPEANLHAVPEGVPDEAAVFAEPVAAACEVLDQARVRMTDRALVVGAGKLGLLVAQVLGAAGCEVAVLVRSDARARLVRELGATPLAATDPPARAFDVVVEASGEPAGFAEAVARVRPRGTIVLKSTYAGSLDLWAAGLVIDEIAVVGSRCGPFAPALAMLGTGAVRVAPLVGAVLPLAKGLRAFDLAARPGALKVVLRIADG
jgi:alcohol dehydrogenase